VGTPPPPEKDSHPNRGTLGQQRTDRMWLSADQLGDDDGKPSWKAPKEKNASRFPPARIATIAILLIILALVIVLKATGSI
jgi:hypothetical protein